MLDSDEGPVVGRARALGRIATGAARRPSTPSGVPVDDSFVRRRDAVHVPDSGRDVIAGRRFVARSLTRVGFGGEPLRMTVVVPA
jgi:hypothetical protein